MPGTVPGAMPGTVPNGPFAPDRMNATAYAPTESKRRKPAGPIVVLSILGLTFLSFAGLMGLIWVNDMGVIGIMKANEAERFGTAASGGRIMGWINAAFGGLFLVVIGGFLLLGLIGAAGAASSSSNHFTELVSTLALF